MYGTREAPLCWQRFISSYLGELGFEAGVGNPCVFLHRERDLRLMVHVDDFLATGAGSELQWLKGKVQEKFECTGDVLGPDEGQKKEVRYLNRILRWTDRNRV